MPKIDQIPICPTVRPAPPQTNQQTYEIELITPMFGGGVIAREIDTNFPIRATSIRGQLQFWWRATVGGRYSSRDELRAAQSVLWGDTSNASRIQVRVELLRCDLPKACAVIKPNQNGRKQVFWEPPFQNTSLPYALFPFQGQTDSSKDSKDEPASCLHSAKFRLILTYSQQTDFVNEVEPAMWAWVNFGGLGSRTRRGCGSIKSPSLLAKDRNDLIARLKNFLSQTSAKEWPTLAAAFFVGKENTSALNAWDDVIGRMRDFRQKAGIGRNTGTAPNRPGRSRWPEPETIRRITGRRNTRHSRLTHIPDNAFPRAEFGLPIVFHFQNPSSDNPKDPEDTTLYPDQNRERMASPLILKALALANGKFVPIIIRLKTPPLTGVDLRDSKKRSLTLPNPTLIRGTQLTQYQNSPMNDRSPNGSAIEAFLKFSELHGFTEVKS